MVVPRAYAQAVPRRAKSTEFNEKSSLRRARSSSNSTRARSSLSSSLFGSQGSSPTKKESRNVKLQPQSPTHEDVPARPGPLPLVPTENETNRFRKETTKDLLSSTAIPIRKKPRGRLSQRLPKGDHVANFSTLLMGDLKAHSTGNLSRSASGSNLEGLFGNMDELLEEGQMFVGSEGLDSGILTTRSMSDESLVSLPSPNDYTSDDHTSQHSCGSQPVPGRRFRHFVTSEDCTDDHPLSLPRHEEEEDDVFTSRASSTSPTPPLKALAGKSDKKPRQSLTSSLTASLKALRSAAQSVSNRNYSPPLDGRPKSIFDFHPSLTDDRRPPVSLESPTAELRRYLSPPPLDSAAQLHFWQDHRHSKLDSPPQSERESRRRSTKGKRSLGGRSPSPPGSNPRIADLPAIVPLASCLPPSIRTEHASSPPIWLTQDGTPVNKNTAIPLLYDPDANDGKGEPVGVRHREPRENRDFLRVFVCEMQMRRNGKLSEDLGAGRARLWLPPVTEKEKSANAKVRKEGEQIVVPPPAELVNKKRSARERLVSTSVDDV